MSEPSTEVSPPPLKRRRLLPQPTSSLPPARSPKIASSTSARQAAHALRIFSWNINGITSFLPPSTPKITNFLKAPAKETARPQPCLRACLRHWSWPHLVALQEVKIAPTDCKTQATVQRLINVPLDSDDEEGRARPLYDAHYCLPQDKYNATGFGGKVYGVCTLVRRDLGDVEFKSVDWDLEGRVLLCEIPGQNLVVFNVYAVNGTIYDYRDPETGKVVGNRHHRKRAFHTRLSDHVRQYEVKGWNAVIVGDINISRTGIDSFPQLRMSDEHVRNRRDFEGKFMDELHMIDSFRYLKGDERKYTYRPTGKPWGSGGDRVDMCLASAGLASRLDDADILDSEEDRGPSDHVPLYILLSGAAQPSKIRTYT